MPQIVAVRTKDDSSHDTIAVVLSQDAICLGPDGQPWSGVSLNAQLARSFADRLLRLAEEIESEKPMPNGSASRSLIQATSILVLHDGTGQGHRAFVMALDLASRSLASLHFVGIYGVRHDRFKPSSAVDDYTWQCGWLDRLVQTYSRDAAQAGIDFRTRLVAADDQEQLSLVCDGEFDLIVVPRRFSDDAAPCDDFATFRQSLSNAAASTILVCP